MTDNFTPLPGETMTQWWDRFYTEQGQVWSGNPNVALVREVAGMTPGTALDLGCAEGADPIWLAQQGWTVLGVDVSQVALDRASARSALGGTELAERITWRQFDLLEEFPDGQFDLVTASFFHSPGDNSRDEPLRRAAAAVAPGGTLLIVSHVVLPGDTSGHDDVMFDSIEETLRKLELDTAGVDAAWTVDTLENVGRTGVTRHGDTVPFTDGVVKVRRRL